MTTLELCSKQNRLAVTENRVQAPLLGNLPFKNDQKLPEALPWHWHELAGPRSRVIREESECYVFGDIALFVNVLQSSSASKLGPEADARER